MGWCGKVTELAPDCSKPVSGNGGHAASRPTLRWTRNRSHVLVVVRGAEISHAREGLPPHRYAPVAVSSSSLESIILSASRS